MAENSVNAFWVRIADVLKERISSQDWCSWFAGAGIVELGAEGVSIEFVNDWAAGWVDAHFRAVLEAVVHEVSGAPLRVTIVSRETTSQPRRPHEDIDAAVRRGSGAAPGRDDLAQREGEERDAEAVAVGAMQVAADRARSEAVREHADDVRDGGPSIGSTPPQEAPARAGIPPRPLPPLRALVREEGADVATPEASSTPNTLTEAELRAELAGDDAAFPTLRLPDAGADLAQPQPRAPEMARAARAAEVDQDFAATRRLNPRYTFDTFVIGAGNQMAHASALSVAETPSQSFNPLFIHGGTGLGKTHLLHAIGQYVAETRPEARVAYITAEQFVMRFTQSLASMRTGTTGAEKFDPRDRFKEYFRAVDVLLMDDVQFFAGKGAAVLEELFHIFNDLHQTGRQVVLTADCRPGRIQRLEERLQTRFAWGLTTDIETPDRETRIAILRKKARGDRVDVPYEVFEEIAERITTNVRELEGALTRVVAAGSLSGEAITMELAARVLEHYAPQQSRPVTIERIQEVVCDHFALSREELLSDRRTRALTHPRQVAMYLSRVLIGAASTRVGASFNRDHSTVLHAATRIEQLMKRDQEVLDLVAQLTATVRGTSGGVQHAR